MARALTGQVTIHPLGPGPERMVLRATILVPQRSALARLSEAKGFRRSEIEAGR
jgi:hypothetical protein